MVERVADPLFDDKSRHFSVKKVAFYPEYDIGMGRAVTSKNRRTVMVGGRSVVQNIRMAARQARLMVNAATDALKRARDFMNQQAARNALKNQNLANVNQSVVQVEANQDTSRAEYIQQMQTALEETTVSRPTAQEVTDDTLTDMTVLTSAVVPQSPDAVAERIQLQMQNLAQTAQVQMQAVQSAQMAQIIQNRTQVAIQALAKQLSAAQILRFKADFAKALAADIVIGAILNQTLLEVNATRGTNITDTGNYNVADPTTDLASSETVVMQDVYALMTAVFISRGSVSELTDTLAQNQLEMAALGAQLQTLMNEGGDLVTLEGQISQIVIGMSQAVDVINTAIIGLEASLQSINNALNNSTFLLDSEYTDYVALKGYVDSQIASLQEVMNGLQTYLGGIHISSDLAEIQRQKDLQATKLGVFRDALYTVSTDPTGAQGALDTARTEYALALDAINHDGPNLTAAATAVPGIGDLTAERGAMPTQPTATAPSVQITLLGETPKLQVPLGTIYALKDSVNTGQRSIDSYQQILLTTPLGNLVLKQSDLRDVIQTLALLRQRPSYTFVTGLDTTLQGLYTSMTTGPLSPADRGALDAANSALSKLRGDMATTESTRRGYVMSVLTISVRTSNNTEKLLTAQSLLDRQTLAARIAQLDLSTPSKPSISGVVTASMNASRMTAQLDSKRGELVLNLELQLEAKTNLALARNAAGKYAKFLETRQLVTVTDAAAVVAASDSVTTGAGGVTTAVGNAQGAYTAIKQFTFTMTKAGRTVDRAQALHDSLFGRQTTEGSKSNLDVSRPSNPSLTTVVNLASEKGATTTTLQEQGRQATIMVVKVAETVTNLDLAGVAAGKHADINIAELFVAADGTAIIVAQGNIDSGIIALSDATTAASTAFTEINTEYTTMQTVYIGLTSVEGTIVYLQTTVIPGINIDVSTASTLSDTTFTFLTTRRLFPQSLSIFGVSTSDLRAYYANKMKIKVGISTSRNAESLQNLEGDITLSFSIINDNKTAAQTLSATIDGLKAELASSNLTDTSVYTIISDTLDAQDSGLSTVQTAADTLSSVTAAMNAASTHLSDSTTAVADGKQFVQILINTNVALSDMRMRLVLLSTIQTEKDRLTQLSQSHQDTMDTARAAAGVAAAAAVNTPSKPDTSAVQALEDAKAALDPNEKGNTERLLQLYNDMKNDPSFINGKAEIEQFFQEMGTTYDTMQDAKMRLIEKLSELQYEAVVLDTARARMAELQELLEGAKGLDVSLILRDADIAKLMGEAAAYKMQQSTAKAAKESAAVQAAVTPSTTEIMANIALLESLQQQYQTLLSDTNAKEADLLALQSRIDTIMQELNGIDTHTLLRNAQIQLALTESERALIEARILAEKANQTVNVNALAQLTAELARLNAQIAALQSAIESITKLETLKADIMQNNPQNTPANNNIAAPPLSVNMSFFLKMAGAATALALGGLAFYYLGPNNLHDMLSSDCDKGKKAAEDAIKENSMAVRQQANFAGLKWAKQNTTAGETSAAPSLPDVPPAEEEPAPPTEEEQPPPTEEDTDNQGATGDMGANMEGGDSSYAIPQENEANEAEGEEGEEGDQDEQGATGDTGPQAQEGDEGTSFSAPGIPQKGTREQLTSADTQIPQSILDKIYAKYLVPPIVLKYTYGKAPSTQFISCFKKKVETELGGMWSSAFTAGANGMSLFDFSGLIGDLLGSAATAVTNQGNQETAGDTGDIGTSTTTTTSTTGAQGEVEPPPSYARIQEEQAAANPYAYY